MGLRDHNLMYSDGQDVTVTADSTSYVDHGVARDLGAGEQMYLLLAFGAVVSNAALVAKIQGDDDGAGTNIIDIAVGKSITPLTGTKFAIPVPPHVAKRFTKCNYAVTGWTAPHIPITATLTSERELRDTVVVY